ncbi:Holliday junction branch migration DNA helicase RuvB [Candidatus Wolfebacteria bacterium]|nr:Holliday junction branch migration DNA helicase RuvB [Candidatus Wolfebacteria bacterium]
MSKYKNKKTEDKFIDSFLRPDSWDEYIGQEKIKKNLNLILKAAKKRKEAIDHLLFYGPTGLGKTTLATLVAKEMKANLRITTGPAIQKVGELAAILSSLEDKDILFIDEIHRLNRSIEEVLYPALDSHELHLVIGKGLGSRMVSLNLPSFTLVAATTRPNLLSSPLRSRFGATFQFDYYLFNEIEIIIQRSADLMGIKIKPEAVSLLSRVCRFTPRIANRLLKRVRDFSEVNNLKIIDTKAVEQTLEFMEIDCLGLEPCERKLLETIIKKFNNQPVGINTLTAALSEEKGVIEEVYEPYLIKLGLLRRTSSGRVTTSEARNHLKIFNK